MNYAIRNIPADQQTEEMCIEACKFRVSKNSNTITHPLQYCAIRTYPVLSTAYNHGREHRFYIFSLMTAEEQNLVPNEILDALNWTPEIYPYIYNPTDEQITKMVSWGRDGIHYIPKPISPEMQIMLVNQNVYNITLIETPTFEAKLQAVRSNPDIIISIANAELELKQEAIRLKPSLRRNL